MKKILCLLVLVSLLLSGCSLSSFSSAFKPFISSDPAETQAPIPASVQTPEPVVIYDAFFEAGTYSDEFNNSWDYLLRIPAIQTSGADATRLNQEAFAALYPAVLDAKNAMAGEYSLVVYRVDYVVFINDELISILCETDNDWGFESYYTINFDASTKTEVNRAQLLLRFGMTEEQFLDKAFLMMQQHFQQNYSAIPKDQMYWDRYNLSTARENFTSDCQLYVNDDGELCMIVKLYSFAGADYYYHSFVVC